jgi:hypothetical protein
MPEPVAGTVELGPGAVAIDTTRVYDTAQSVRIAPGTQLRVATGASLIFLGPVHFAGTARAPIAIEPAGAEPWGGIVLQGMHTAGSRFEYVNARGGSTPAWRGHRYPGMIDLHDTRDVAIRNCRFTDNHVGDDLVHAAYVDGLLVEDTQVGRSHRDAWDLEFTRAVLRRLQVGAAGDDALDLMAAHVELSDSVLIGARGNAVSAGEESDVRLQDTLAAETSVGVLAKNHSSVSTDGSLLFRANTGVRVYTRSNRYAGDSRVQADVLFVVDSTRPIRREDQGEDTLDLGRVQVRLPHHDTLTHLQKDVLGLSDWSALPDYVAQRKSAWEAGSGELAAQQPAPAAAEP